MTSQHQQQPHRPELQHRRIHANQHQQQGAGDGGGMYSHRMMQLQLLLHQQVQLRLLIMVVEKLISLMLQKRKRSFFHQLLHHMIRMQHHRQDSSDTQGQVASIHSVMPSVLHQIDWKAFCKKCDKPECSCAYCRRTSDSLPQSTLLIGRSSDAVRWWIPRRWNDDHWMKIGSWRQCYYYIETQTRWIQWYYTILYYTSRVH